MLEFHEDKYHGGDPAVLIQFKTGMSTVYKRVITTETFTA